MVLPSVKFICLMLPASPFPSTKSMLFIDENMSFGHRLWESRIKALNILPGVTLVLKDWLILTTPMFSLSQKNCRNGGMRWRGGRRRVWFLWCGVVWEGINGHDFGLLFVSVYMHYAMSEERGGELVLLEGSLTRIVFVSDTDISLSICTNVLDASHWILELIFFKV